MFQKIAFLLLTGVSALGAEEVKRCSYEGNTAERPFKHIQSPWSEK